MDRDNKSGNSRDNSRNYPNQINNRDGWEQYSNKLGDKIADIEDEAAFLDEINSSLAKQISSELEGNSTNMSDKRPVKKSGLPKGLKVFAIVFSIIMVMGGLLIFTSPGRKILFNVAGNYLYGKLDYEESGTKPVLDNTKGNDDKENTTKPAQHIVNILLLGVEEIGGASNTDVMIIATMNTKDKTMKLTSLMRDLYVEIPGYNNNKLNSVYAKDGIDLLYTTIENNFGIKLDGYALVNFESFEKIVDLVGGVEITLTSGEAHYLNTTNYISNPAYRNVKEGVNLFNGNQAVGYCRVRKVSTGTENNDFGRTQRHRKVLNAIFDKVKTKNILELGLLMNKILGNLNIKTDITQGQFNNYLEEAASLNVKKLSELRIPSDGNYKNEKVPIGKYNQDVLVPTDWEATKKEIHDFIYGAQVTTTTNITPATE